MGSFYVNYQIRAHSAAPVIAAARRVCVGLAYVAPACNGWVALYDEASDGQDEAMLHHVAQNLSAELATSVFAFLVHDSDVFRYMLYECGDLVAEFDSWPDYQRRTSELEHHDPPEATPQPRSDQLMLFDVGDPQPAPTSKSAEAVLRLCRPGTTLGAIYQLLRQDRWSDIDEAMREDSWMSCPGNVRLVGLARLLGIEERLVCTAFKYLEEHVYQDGRQALPGVRKVRGKGTVRPRRNAGPPGSLAAAVAAGDVVAVSRFLAEGLDVGIPDKRNSLLRMAASRGHFEIVLALLGAGIWPSNGESAELLMWAVSFGRPDVVEQLVAAGADVAAMGHFALFGAVTATSSDRPTHATVEALELLLRVGADLHARSDQGMTPLGQAVLEGHREFVEVLLRAGADINALDGNGRTALFWAVLREARSRSRRIVRFLLQCGADPNIRNEQGMTALMLATAHPMSDRVAAKLVAELIRAQADVNMSNTEGDTALSIALRYRHHAAAELLRAGGAR